MPTTVITVRAQAGETVEIQWRLDDGGSYATRHTVPPRATRETAQRAAAPEADNDVPPGSICTASDWFGPLCAAPAVRRCRLADGGYGYVCERHIAWLKPRVPDAVGFRTDSVKAKA